ncbi:MAG: hypothetical protein KDB20_17390, partial [Microthrixaceae bacterium]|nr:hypothetical protein [Microthrixaceae bacterium]
QFRDGPLGNFLNWVWPSQYQWYFADSFPAGGAPTACNFNTGSAPWTGFGNFLVVRSNSPRWSNGGTVKGIAPTSAIEYKTWACMDGGATAARFTACTTHFWPNDVKSGEACSSMEWFRANVMNSAYSRYLNLVSMGDLYLTRVANSAPGVGGTLNQCTAAPGMLNFWKSNFAAGGPVDNSRTLGVTNAQVDHIIIDPGHGFAFGSGFTYEVSGCPAGTTFERCNLTDHLLVRALPNI